MSSSHTIIVINPGSTSTKVAVYRDSDCFAQETLSHSSEELKSYPSVWDQFLFRLLLCREWIGLHTDRCDAIAAMGGLVRPLEGGVYAVNKRLLDDSRANVQGEHASNLGAAIASELASQWNAPSFIVDGVSVDEFEPLARYSGHPLIERRSLSHALNIHAAARRAAVELNKPLEDSTFIVAHLGGGISIAPVRNNRIIDVNDAASDGPFSPERTGGLPLQPFITLCSSGTYTQQEMRKLVMGKGGLTAYLGTHSVPAIEKMIDAGDRKAAEIFEAMAYQISKEIGAMATVVSGGVDAIILTGGLAKSERLTRFISQRVKFIANILIYPGEDELRALAEGARRALTGEEQIKEY